MNVLQTNRKNINEYRLVEAPAKSLQSGQIRLSVERFSFTANNVTYAVMGDMIKYWQFFPSTDENGKDVSSEWGQIPVWGFATVSESQSDAVAVGERYFGYFPPSDQVVMKPTPAGPGSFVDASDHRASLPAGYNVYRAASTKETQADNERSMLYPLFVTAYAIQDFFASRDWYQAEQVLIISASSKTSIGVAYAMADNTTTPKAVGLTSSRNIATVDGLNLYDQSVAYDSMENLDVSKRSVIIDMSGNQQVLADLHKLLGDNMAMTLNVGITHWDEMQPKAGLIRDRCEQFFAPSHIQEMMKRMGPQEFQADSTRFVSESALKTRSWLQIKELDSLQELTQHYQAVFDGKVDANTGLIVNLT